MPNDHHDTIAELLPDYVVGASGDDEARIAAHLESCPICQREFSSLLETVGLMTEVAPPDPRVKQVVLARAFAPSTTPMETSSRTRAYNARQLAPESNRRRRTTSNRFAGWWPRLIAPVAIACLLIAVVGLALWNRSLRDEDTTRNTIASLLLDAEAAHPLTDSETNGVAGIAYVDPSAKTALLVAQGLPELPENQQYQVWLFKEDGERISAGLFRPQPNGTAQVVIDAPTNFADYWALGLCAAPVGGSDAPTAPLTLGGWLK